MVAYAVRRLLGAIPVVFIGLTLTFFIIHVAPGDPTSRFLNPSIGIEANERIIERFGLDNPLHVQYFSWLGRILFHFDFGYSFNSGQAASEVILDALPSTLLLTFFSLLFGLLVGVFGGVISAIYRGRTLDRIITVVMLFFYSMPAFWLGMIFLGLFAIKLNWLPSSHITSVFHDQLSPLGQIADYAKHLVLPVITLGLTSAATFGRYIRTSMIEALNSEYVLAARARGISQYNVLFCYTFRSALIPLISILGLMIPILFSGAVVIEVVFSIPGMGRVMVNSVLGRDYPVILAASTLAFFSVIIGNLLADIGYAVADPRVRLKGGNS